MLEHVESIDVDADDGEIALLLEIRVPIFDEMMARVLKIDYHVLRFSSDN